MAFARIRVICLTMERAHNGTIAAKYAKSAQGSVGTAVELALRTSAASHTSAAVLMSVTYLSFVNTFVLQAWPLP